MKFCALKVPRRIIVVCLVLRRVFNCKHAQPSLFLDLLYNKYTTSRNKGVCWAFLIHVVHFLYVSFVVLEFLLCLREYDAFRDTTKLS